MYSSTTADELSPEFWRQFPDGRVPIVAVPEGLPADVGEWEDWLRKFDLAHSYDVDAIEELASLWRELFNKTDRRQRGGGQSGLPQAQAREQAQQVMRDLREVTVALLGHGLSLRAIANYVGVAVHHVARAYCLREKFVAPLLAADELVEDMTLTSTEIARRTGYGRFGVNELRKARGLVGSTALAS